MTNPIFTSDGYGDRGFGARSTGELLSVDLREIFAIYLDGGKTCIVSAVSGHIVKRDGWLYAPLQRAWRRYNEGRGKQVLPSYG